MPMTKSLIAPPSDDVLADLYTGQKLGCPEIARMYERDATTVYYWLRRAGIPTRARGTDPAQWFSKGGDPRSFSGTKHSAATKAKLAIASKERKPWLRNGIHWLHTVPPEMNPKWNGGSTPERQEFYRSSEWKAAVKAVWRRDNAKCQCCGLDWRTVDRTNTATFHIHHIASFAVRELRADVGNLVLLCRPCHLWVHSNANVNSLFIKQIPEISL